MTAALSASLAASVIALGLMSGIVFAYANSVMPGLARADDRTAMEASRGMIGAITNPLFLAISNLALVVTIVAAALALLAGTTAVVVLTLVALLAYVVTLAITFRGNLPLNKRLLGAGLQSPEDCARAREDFEASWNRRNLARTISCIIAFCAAAIALAL